MRRPPLLAILAALFLTSALSAQATSSTTTPSLYKRLGGYDAVAAVTDDLIGRLVADK